MIRIFNKPYYLALSNNGLYSDLWKSYWDKNGLKPFD
jgi:hypothetical protein